MLESRVVTLTFYEGSAPLKRWVPLSQGSSEIWTERGKKHRERLLQHNPVHGSSIGQLPSIGKALDTPAWAELRTTRHALVPKRWAFSLAGVYVLLAWHPIRYMPTNYRAYSVHSNSSFKVTKCKVENVREKPKHHSASSRLFFSICDAGDWTQITRQVLCHWASPHPPPWK